MSKPEAPGVYVDLSTLPPDGTSGGAARFVLRLLADLARGVGPSLVALVKPESAGVVRALAGGRLLVEVLGERIREPRRLRREIRRLPFGLGRLAPDASSLRRHGASALLSPLFTAAFHEPGLPHVAVAHDFQELAFPGHFGAAELRRRSSFRADLRRADHVVATSEATRRDAVEKAGLAPERLSVLPPLAGPPPAPVSPGTLHERLLPLGLVPGGFAFYPANFWPHKNHERLLRAAVRVRAEESSFRLVLCGALDAARDRLAVRVSELELGGTVTVLGYVPDGEVAALLQGARFLAFPSLFEGFGIPVFEALRLGTPVACSDLPSLRETAGGAALTFDPADEGAMAAALVRIWRDDGLRARLAASGRARGDALAAIDVAGGYARLLGRFPRTGVSEVSRDPA